MGTRQASPHTPNNAAVKPSLSLSSIASAASASSAGTPRSGGSRLLFGEIDTTSDRSDSYASVCSLVLSDSSIFTRFWLLDDCRESLLSHLNAADLANLRLVCHDFSVRAAPALFSDLSITFRPNTFTKPSKQAALHRIGFHVKTLTFRLRHGRDTFLPPLIHPETGDELSYTYTPRTQPLAIRQPRYGDWETTEILTRQYPPLFHAATNVDAFVQAFSAFVNLTHLTVACPDHDAASRYRRSAVDFALVSLRIATERNCLNALDSLTLSPIHPGGLLCFSPVLGYGAGPSSTRRWSRIKHLTMHCDALPVREQTENVDQLKLVQTFLFNFKQNLHSFKFRWNNHKGSLPIAHPRLRAAADDQHPALAKERPSTATTPTKPSRRPSHKHNTLYFPHLRHLEIENASSSAAEIATVVAMHKKTLDELDFQAIDLKSGTWEQAFAPLTKMVAKSRTAEIAEIPIMLSPTTASSFPQPMERIEIIQHGTTGRKSFRASSWLRSKKVSHILPRTPLLQACAAGGATSKVRQGLQECESQVKRILRGTVFQRK